MYIYIINIYMYIYIYIYIYIHINKFIIYLLDDKKIKLNFQVLRFHVDFNLYFSAWQLFLYSKTFKTFRRHVIALLLFNDTEQKYV